jgi:hypothetical protein
VLRAEFSAPKMGKFLERAEIHAPLILLPASVRSFESPGAEMACCTLLQILPRYNKVPSWRPPCQKGHFCLIHNS